jgi:hypothetical protein
MQQNRPNAIFAGSVKEPAALATPRSFLWILVGFELIIWGFIIGVLVYPPQKQTVVPSGINNIIVHNCYVQANCGKRTEQRSSATTVSSTNNTLTIDGSKTLRCMVDLCILDGDRTADQTLSFKLSNAVLSLHGLGDTLNGEVPFPVDIVSDPDADVRSVNKVFLGASNYSDVHVSLTKGLIIAADMTSPNAILNTGFGTVILASHFTTNPFILTGTVSDNNYCISPRASFVASPCINVTQSVVESALTNGTNITAVRCPVYAAYVPNTTALADSPVSHFSVSATALYLNNQRTTDNHRSWTAADDTRIAGSGMDLPPTLDPSVLDQLNATATWLSLATISDYVQAIEVVTPSVGMIFLHASRGILLEIGPEWLSFYSAYALTPNYRRIYATLSHYRCDAAPVQAQYTGAQSLTDTIDVRGVAEFSEVALASMLQEHLSRVHLYSLATNIFNTVNQLAAMVAFQTPSLEWTTTDPQTILRSGDIWQVYTVSRDADNGDVVVSPLEATPVGLAIQIIAAVTSLLVVLYILAVLIYFRNEIAAAYLLIDVRKIQRVSVDYNELCPYHYFFSVLTLSSWIAFRFNMYAHRQITGAVLKPLFGRFLEAFFIRMSNDSTEDRALSLKMNRPIALSALTRQFNAYAMLRYAQPSVSPEELTDVVANMGGRIVTDKKLVVRGICKKEFVKETAQFALEYTALQGFYDVTFSSKDEVLLDEIYFRAMLADSTLTEDDVAEKLRQWNLTVESKSIQVVQGIRAFAFTKEARLAEEELTRIVGQLEYNCASFPSYGFVEHITAGPQAKYRALKRLAWSIWETGVVFSITFLPFLMCYAISLPLEVEHAKYSVSTSILQEDEVGLTLGDRSVPRPTNPLSSLIFASGIVFSIAVMVEPITVLLTFRAVALWRERKYMIPLLVLRACASTVAVLLQLIFTVFALWYVATVSIWWLLGVIIAPNRMLVYAASLFTFFYVIYSMYTGSMTLRKAAIQQLEHRILSELLKMMRKSGAGDILDAMGGNIDDAEDSAERLKALAEEKNAVGQQGGDVVTPALLMDVASDDSAVRNAAIERLGVALRMPAVVVLLSLAVIDRKPEDVSRAVRLTFEQLDIPQKFAMLSTQLIFQGLGLPVSATDLAHGFYPLTPQPYRTQLKANDATVVALTHAALQEDLDAQVINDVLANVMIVQLSDATKIPQVVLFRMFHITQHVYNNERPDAFHEVALLLTYFKTLAPRRPLATWPLLQCFIECLLMASGSKKHNLRQAATDLLQVSGLGNTPIIKALKPLLLGTSDGTKRKNVKLIDDMAVASAAVATLEVKFSISQEQQNMLRMLCSLLDGNTTALATIRPALLPKDDLPHTVFEEALRHYELMVRISIGRATDAAMLPQWEAQMATTKAGLHAGTMLGAWLADQWMALYALHTFHTELPPLMCDTERFELVLGVPAEALHLFRDGVNVVLLLLRRVVGDAKLTEMSVEVQGHVETPAMRADVKSIDGDVAEAQKEYVQAKRALQRGQQSHVASASGQQELQDRIGEEADAAARVARLEQERAAAENLCRGVSGDALRVLNAIEEITRVLFRDQQWNTGEAAVQLGANFIHTFMEKLRATVAKSLVATGDQVEAMQAASKADREKQVKEMAMTVDTVSILDVMSVGNAITDALSSAVSSINPEFKAQLVLELVSVFRDGKVTVEELAVATKSVAGMLLHHDGDTRAAQFIDAQLETKLASASWMPLLDDAIDFYMDRNGAALDIAALAGLFGMTPAAMNVFIHPEVVCRRVPELRGKEFLFELMQGATMQQFIAADPEKSEKALRGFFVQLGIQPEIFAQVRRRFLSFSTQLAVKVPATFVPPFRPTGVTLIFDGKFTGPISTVPLVKPFQEDLARLFRVQVDFIRRLTVTITPDQKRMKVDFRVAPLARMRTRHVTNRLDACASGAATWRNTNAAYESQSGDAGGLKMRTYPFLRVNDIVPKRPYARRLPHLTSRYMETLKARESGHHEDLARVMAHISLVKAHVDDHTGYSSDDDEDAESVDGGVPQPPVMQNMLHHCSDLPVFGGTEDEAVEACLHLQALRIMWKFVDLRLLQVMTRNNLGPNDTPRGKKPALGGKKGRKKVKAPKGAVSDDDAPEKKKNKKKKKKAGADFDTIDDKDDSSSSDDDDSSNDDDDDDVDELPPVDAYWPLAVKIGKVMVDLKLRVTNQIMAVMAKITPRLHEHLQEQLALAHRERRGWLDDNTQHLSVQLACLKQVIDDCMSTHHAVAAFLFHEEEEDVKGQDADKKADSDSDGSGSGADGGMKSKFRGLAMRALHNEQADSPLPGTVESGNNDGDNDGRVMSRPHSMAEEAIEDEGVSGGTTARSRPGRVLPARKQLRRAAQKLLRRGVPCLDMDERVEYAYVHASPFTLIDVRGETPPVFRFRFGVLCGYTAWYPADLPRAFFAAATISVQRAAVPLDVLSLLTAQFPIKMRRLVMGIATLAAGKPQHPTLLALADYVGVPFEVARRVHRVLLPRQAGATVLADGTLKHAPVNWFCFLRAVSQGNLFALLRYDQLIDAEVTALSVVHANTPAVRGALKMFYHDNPVLLRKIEMLGGDIADEFGDLQHKAFPLLFGLIDRHMSKEDATATRTSLRLVTGTICMMRSDFRGALTEYEAFSGGDRQRLLSARLGVLLARLVIEDGAVNDTDAVIEVCIDLLHELPKWMKCPPRLRPKHLGGVLETVVPFVGKYLPMMMKGHEGKSLEQVLREHDPLSSAVDAAEDSDGDSDDDDDGASDASGEGEVVDVYSTLIIELGEVLKVIVRCMTTAATAAGQVAKHADLTIDVTVKALLACRSSVSLPDVIDHIIALMRVAEAGAAGGAASGQSIVDSAVGLNSAIREMSGKSGQGPKLFMGLLSYAIQQQQKVQQQQFEASMSISAGQSTAVGATAVTEMAEEDELYASDQDKIQIVLAFANGDHTVLAQLLKAAGVQPQCETLQQFKSVFNMISTLRRMSMSQGTARFETTDLLDIVSAEIFKELDTQNVGILSFDDFKMALDRMYIDVTEHQAKLWFQDIDVDKSGGITESEFQRAIKGVLNHLQNQMLEELHLSRPTIYVSLIWVAVILMCLLTFLILGVYGFTDGTAFSAVTTSAMPMLGAAVSTVKDPTQLKMLLAKIDAAAIFFFERVAEARKAAKKHT